MNGIPPLQPLARDQRNIDADHLKLLAIFHFVGAGLAFLGIIFLSVHFLFMHTMINDPNFMGNPKFYQNQKPMPSPAALFAIFKWFYLLAGAWFIFSAILNIISGICLCVSKYRTFSLVGAGINCLHLPFGTILGIFTIIVLTRHSVREMYAEKIL